MISKVINLFRGILTRKNYFRYIISIFTLLLFSNSVNAQFKILEDLKKTGEQILKEEEKTKEKSTKPAPSAPATPPAKTQQETKPAPSAPAKPVEKPTQAVKQTAFSKSYRMMCSYQADGKVTQATYAVDGLKFTMNTITVGLGEKIKTDEAGGYFLALRQGSSNIVIVENNSKIMGFIQTITVDFDKVRADQVLAPMNRTYIGVCNKLS